MLTLRLPVPALAAQAIADSTERSHQDSKASREAAEKLRWLTNTLADK